MPGAAIIMVMADEHPQRDEWVDDRAREAQQVLQLVTIGDDTYRGVWTTPDGARAHIFALSTDLIRLEQLGGYRPPRCRSCGCRTFPQDGPGVHARTCSYGWAMYGTCDACGARAGDPCVSAGTHPHNRRRLATAKEAKNAAMR